MFTDLVNSTVLLQKAGDESGADLFQAHHKLLSDAIASTGGDELEWLGDGVLAAFSSTADAVRCAIAIQQSARRPTAGARFEIRIGIHLGEVLRRDGGYFGTPIVTARRLCDRGTARTDPLQPADRERFTRVASELQLPRSWRFSIEGSHRAGRRLRGGLRTQRSRRDAQPDAVRGAHGATGAPDNPASRCHQRARRGCDAAR